MKHIFTISLCFLALSFSVYGQVPDYVPSDGLVAWYPFNGNANDESPYNNSAAVFGASLTEDRFGLTNSAYFFDGNDHIESPHQGWLNYGTGSTTWVGWGQKTGGNDHAHLLTKGVFTSAPYSAKGTYLRIAPDNFVELGTGQSGAGFESQGYGAGCQNDEVLEDWFHLVGIMNKEEGFASVYVNGELACVGPISYPELNPDQDGLLLIGCEHPYVSLPSGPQYFIGRLDDLGIWNRALSEEEIQSLYNAPPPNPGCTDVTACNYDSMAEFDDGTCQFDDACGVCGGTSEKGCMDSYACNYSQEADCDDGSCDYSCCPGPGCCSIGMYWDWDAGECFITNPSDINLDGCVQLNDLLDLLVDYGDCGTFTCGNLINHEGYDYSTVQIGDQCWFSENCRYLPEVSPSSEGSYTEPYYYVYDYQGTDVEAAMATANYETYGVLYNWPAVMTEGICPGYGWHIPSDAEFTELTNFLGGESVAGGKMKEADYDHWNSPNTGATNSSGWTGLPGGYKGTASNFSQLREGGSWWSTTEYNYSWGLYLYTGWDYSFRFSDFPAVGFSARCVRD